MWPKPTALAAALLAAFAAQAQQEVNPDDNRASPQQLDRVEVRRSQPQDTDLRRRQPVAKQIYGREELDKYGDSQLSDVLKRLPGMNVSGGQLRMRGLGGAFTQILVNGEPAPPGFSIENLNPAQVERIEVSKAPTADQSAQAIAGSVNIILKDAPRVVQKDLRLGLAYNHDKPVVNGSFTYGDRKGGVGAVLPISFFSWRLLNRTESLRRGDDAALQPQQLASQGWDMPYGHGLNVSPRLNWKLGDDESLTLQAFVIHNNFRNVGESDITVLSGSAPSSVDDRFTNRGSFKAARLNFQYNNRFSEDRRIELRAGMGGGGSDFETRFLGRNAAGVQTVDRHTTGEGKNRGATLSGKYSQFLGEAHSMTAGAELERRTRDETRNTVANGVALLPGIEGQPYDATITRSALFVQDEWEINPQWSAYLGLRNERIRTESEGAGSSFRSTSSVLTPLLHLNYKFDPKARDMIRASLTRSYKAPDVQQLIARPTINTNYPSTGPNTETAPDRVGNPDLKPELATGLDIAYEQYLSGGGLVSVGMFHRRITGLIRNSLVQQNVSWATLPRWVAMPINLSRASTSGLELELKGRAGELMPSLFAPTTALNLRASLSVYHSTVKDIPGPDNRLEQQQPWSLNLGADYRMKALPVSMGASLAFTPGYEVQQSTLTRLETGRVRTVDAFLLWNVAKTDSLRFSVQNLAPVGNRSNTYLSNGDYNLSERRAKSWFALNWEHKF